MKREHEEHFQMDIANRQAAQEMWKSILNNPDAPPDVKQHALASFMGIATTPPGKKWDKFTKPYERPQQQPGQQTAPMQLGGQSQPQAPQAGAAPAPPTLAPTAPANPGPQAPLAAGGGGAPGLLQGQANQLPPMAPVAAAPPPPPPTPDLMQPPGGPGGPVTLPGTAIPPVTGPSMPAPLTQPGLAEGQQQTAILLARAAAYQKLVQQGRAQGLSDEDAQRQASMLTGIMPRAGMSTLHPIPGDFTGTQAASMNAVLPDGSPITADDKTHYTMGRDAFGRLIAAPAKANVQGTKTAWKADPNSSTGYSQIRLNQYNEPVGEPVPDLVPPAGLIPKLRHSSTIMDENGNTITTSETRPNLGGAGKPSKPPTPPSSAPKSGGDNGVAPPASGSGRIAWEVKKKGVDAATTSAQKAQEQYQDAISRYNKMEEMAKDGAADPTGATDVAMLAQHMGMTVGDVKGMRTGKDMIEKHLQAIGLDARLARFIDSLNTGHQLSPEQRTSFLKLAESAVGQAQRKAEALDKRVQDMAGGKKSATSVDTSPPPKANVQAKSGSVDVFDPVLNKTLTFKSQADADTYKTKYGIK